MISQKIQSFSWEISHQSSSTKLPLEPQQPALLSLPVSPLPLLPQGCSPVSMQEVLHHTRGAVGAVPGQTTPPFILDISPINQTGRNSDRHIVKTTRGGHHTFIHPNRPGEFDGISHGSWAQDQWPHLALICVLN